jgi:outer membrane protein
VKKITVFSVCAVLAVLVAAAISVNAAETKIGYVDLRKCVTSSIAGRKALETLKVKKDEMQIKLDRNESELGRMKEELEKQGMMLSPEAKREKEKTFQRKVRDYKDMYGDFTDVMRREEEKVTADVIKDLAEIIKKVGKQKGYTFILEKGIILWAADSVDLTDDVTSLYDAQRTKAK